MMIQQPFVVILVWGNFSILLNPSKDLDMQINQKSSPPALSSIQIDWKKLFHQYQATNRFC